MNAQKVFYVSNSLELWKIVKIGKPRDSQKSFKMQIAILCEQFNLMVGRFLITGQTTERVV